MSDKLKVGFVGVGLMGHGMAKHAMLNGHPLTVIANRNRKPIDSLVEKGASEAKSLAELAKASEVIIMCLTDSDTVDQVLFGEDGLAKNANEGTIFIDSTTAYPPRTIEVNKKLRELGHLFADAPLSRTPAKAEEGKLATYTSCEQELFDRIKPILDTYCEVVIYLGSEVGMAHKVKLMNNFIALSMVCTWSEAYNSCIGSGIDPMGLYEVVSGAGLNCLNFQNYSKFITENTQGGHKFSVANARKDVDYYVKFAKEAGLSVTLAEPTLALLNAAAERGYADDFATVMPKVVGEINGTEAGNLPRGTVED